MWCDLHGVPGGILTEFRVSVGLAFVPGDGWGEQLSKKIWMFCLNLTRSTPCPSDPSIFFKLKDNHLFIFKNSKSKAVYVFVCVGVCVQSLKLCPCLFETPWAAAHQASLSFIIFQSLLRLMSIETAMPSNHLILCRPLLLPSIFTSLLVFPKGWQAHK